jgi:hypothetical protein
LWVCHAGDTETPLKLLCRGKLLTADPNASLSAMNVKDGAKVVVMHSRPPAHSGPATSEADKEERPLAGDAKRVLNAVEAMSARASHPHKRTFQVLDQVCLCRSLCYPLLWPGLRMMGGEPLNHLGLRPTNQASYMHYHQQIN